MRRSNPTTMVPTTMPAMATERLCFLEDDTGIGSALPEQARGDGRKNPLLHDGAGHRRVGGCG
jgi:hypothetical protein